MQASNSVVSPTCCIHKLKRWAQRARRCGKRTKLCCHWRTRVFVRTLSVLLLENLNICVDTFRSPSIVEYSAVAARVCAPSSLTSCTPAGRGASAAPQDSLCPCETPSSGAHVLDGEVKTAARRQASQGTLGVVKQHTFLSIGLNFRLHAHRHWHGSVRQDGRFDDAGAEQRTFMPTSDTGCCAGFATDTWAENASPRLTSPNCCGISRAASTPHTSNASCKWLRCEKSASSRCCSARARRSGKCVDR